MLDSRFHPGKTIKEHFLLLVIFFLPVTFNIFQKPNEEAKPEGNCAGVHQRFYGYTFLDPNIINKNAAYAPFFTRWDDYYERYYFDQGAEIQKDENLDEWIERFCGEPLKPDVEYVVYRADMSEIAGLHRSAAEKEKKPALPYRLAGNTFAEMVALNGCTEVTSYLMYAKKCEPFVTGQSSPWDVQAKLSAEMISLIDEGMGRFKNTESHFIKLRYAYQIVRLAHYARDWSYTVDLYNYLLPKIDRKKKSIIYYWTLGHLAGALQKLGKYPEAAYRYSLIFRYCPSKRMQAYRSFKIRNDKDWEETMALCQSDAEKSTLLILRAGGARTFLIEDMQEVYKLDPGNPQLDLMLISEVQELEKLYLRTDVTDKLEGTAIGSLKPAQGSKHLLDLQKFVRKAIREKKTPNMKLWRAIEAYLELLAGDKYAAEKGWERLESNLKKRDDYDNKLLKQLKIWRCLLEIMNMDLESMKADKQAYSIRGKEAFKMNPYFEPFLQQWLADGYARQKHPGKAILAAYPYEYISLNPRIAVYDDLLDLSYQQHPVLLEKTMQIDTNPDQIRAYLLELKGAYLLSVGKPEAALATMRKITPTERAKMAKFTPFREKVGEKVHRIVSDTLLLTRLEIAQKLIDLEFQAKTAEALDSPEAARYWYRIGVAYYNMTYFGYEWEVTDKYRSGYNQLRLSRGPVFPLAGSPEGNKENTNMTVPLSFFEKALYGTNDPELAARAAFMAARCKQKQWFCSPECTYRPNGKDIPRIPEGYNEYYNILINNFRDTKFFNGVVKECKWLEAYAR
ncbi:MAG: hypothetical protein H6576_12585 [Lewinellaceae bacterium]|nr:hypothetical protein [Saprospiraceae bacterium]MCB9344530.1 hypothetical protein [Lewinellaceae bacterium]